MIGRDVVKSMTVALAVALVAPIAAATPPAHGSHAATQSELRQANAAVAAARVKHAALQAEVNRLEQQNAASQQQLQQRDAEIAALQQKLQAGGGTPVSSAPASR